MTAMHVPPTPRARCGRGAVAACTATPDRRIPRWPPLPRSIPRSRGTLTLTSSTRLNTTTTATIATPSRCTAPACARLPRAASIDGSACTPPSTPDLRPRAQPRMTPQAAPASAPRQPHDVARLPRRISNASIANRHCLGAAHRAPHRTHVHTHASPLPRRHSSGDARRGTRRWDLPESPQNTRRLRHAIPDQRTTTRAPCRPHIPDARLAGRDGVAA